MPAARREADTRHHRTNPLSSRDQEWLELLKKTNGVNGLGSPRRRAAEAAGALHPVYGVYVNFEMTETPTSIHRFRNDNVVPLAVRRYRSFWVHRDGLMRQSFEKLTLILSEQIGWRVETVRLAFAENGMYDIGHSATYIPGDGGPQRRPLRNEEDWRKCKERRELTNEMEIRIFVKNLVSRKGNMIVERVSFFAAITNQLTCRIMPRCCPSRFLPML